MIRTRAVAWSALATLTVVGCAAVVTPSTSGPSTPTTGPTVGEIPPADVAWTSIRWRRLDPHDPLGNLATVVRGASGYVATGRPISTITGSRTPLWSSPDGSDWQALSETVVGADSFVVSVIEFPDRFVALTLAGGVDQFRCDVPGLDSCPDTRPPLRAWASNDGTEWTLQAEPLNLVLPSTERSLATTVATGRGQDALVAYSEGLKLSSAHTNDGLTWQLYEPGGLPEFILRGLASTNGVYLLLGDAPTVGSDQRPAVAWASDGRLWQNQILADRGVAVFRAKGAKGVIVEILDTLTAALEWWSTTDGKTWQVIEDFAPLGRWPGAVAEPAGEVAGDDERMIAYDTLTGARAWISFDGVTWTDVRIEGDAPPLARAPGRNLTLTPVGLLWRDDQGRAWFGEPSTD